MSQPASADSTGHCATVKRADTNASEAKISDAKAPVACGADKWQMGDACEKCRVPFAWFPLMWPRRHHCRVCGKSYCYEHANHWIVVDGCGAQPVRICDPCFDLIPTTSSSPPSSALSSTASVRTSTATAATSESATATSATTPATAGDNAVKQPLHDVPTKAVDITVLSSTVSVPNGKVTVTTPPRLSLPPTSDDEEDVTVIPEPHPNAVLSLAHPQRPPESNTKEPVNEKDPVKENERVTPCTSSSTPNSSNGPSSSASAALHSCPPKAVAPMLRGLCSTSAITAASRQRVRLSPTRRQSATLPGPTSGCRNTVAPSPKAPEYMVNIRISSTTSLGPSVTRDAKGKDDGKWVTLAENLNPTGRPAYLSYELSTDVKRAITDIRVVSESVDSSAKTRIPFGYKLVDYDINCRAGNGLFTYLCYTTADNRFSLKRAITHVRAIDRHPHIIPSGYTRVQGDFHGNLTPKTKTEIYLATTSDTNI